MNEDKRKALESAGWKVGSVDEFLGDAKMNVDEAMNGAGMFRAEHEAEQEPGMVFSEMVAITLADEVQRLRAELAAAKAASVVTEMKWQPMETAPKDGIVIVLATTVRVAESSWGVCRPQWDGYVANEGNPCWRASGEEKVRGGYPLCWMPMPAPPDTELKERANRE